MHGVTMKMAMYIFETPRTQICCFQLSQKKLKALLYNWQQHLALLLL